MSQAVILAAGQGTRLRPHTEDKPKALVPVGGHPILAHVLEVMKQCRIEDIKVVGGYRAENLQEMQVDVHVNKNFLTTNMVASLAVIRPWVNTASDLIVSYGDIIYEERVLAALMDKKADTELAVIVDRNWKKLWEIRMENPLADAETLKVDQSGCITELGKKANSYDDIQGQYTGLFKINSKVVDTFFEIYENLPDNQLYDGKDKANMYMTSFLQLLIDRGWKAKAVEVQNGWIEVDTVEDLATYEGLLKKGELNEICTLPLRQ